MKRVSTWLGVLVLLGGALLWTGAEGWGQAGAVKTLAAALSSSQEVPAPEGGVPAGAVGSASLLFDPADNTLSFAVAYSGLNGPVTVAHFHAGAAGAPGGVVQTICGQPAPPLLGECPSGANSGFLTGTWQVPGELVGALLGGGLYINLHTAANAPGELRGQVWPQ